METTTSLWMHDALDDPPRSALDADTEVDVVVIGGGIVGLATAWYVGQSGRRVLLLEARRVGSGVTGHTTAKVTALHGATYHSMAERHGQRTTRAYASAQQQGLQALCDLVDREQIECDLRRLPAYTYTTADDQVATLRAEADAAATAGLPATFVEETPLPFPVAAAVRVDEQAQFQPWSFMRGVLAAAERAGVRVCEQTRVRALHERGGLRLTTESGYDVRADDIVVSTHYPIFDRAGLFARVTVNREFAVAGPWAEYPLEGMFYGIGPAAPSVRTADGPSGPVVVVSGQLFRPGTGRQAARLAELISLARQRLPGLGEVQHRWAAQDVSSHDGLPYVGQLTPWSSHVHVATGFAGWGMTNGMAAALAITGRIADDIPAWSRPFDPTRLVLPQGLPALLGEQAQVARSLVGGYLPVGDLSVDEAVAIPPGTGDVVSARGSKYAVYCDDSGRQQVLNARCTHLGCIVSFNGAERTWECPCHGSRFDVDGSVLSGPATAPLRPASLPPE